MSRVLDHVVWICYHRCQLMMLTATQGISSLKAWNCWENWSFPDAVPLNRVIFHCCVWHRVIYVALYPSHGDRDFEGETGLVTFFPALEAGGGVQEGRVLIGTLIGNDRWFHDDALLELSRISGKDFLLHFFFFKFWTWQKIWTANTHSEDAVHLLAFHPCREDRGPACRVKSVGCGTFLCASAMAGREGCHSTPKGCDIFPLPGQCLTWVMVISRMRMTSPKAVKAVGKWRIDKKTFGIGGCRFLSVKLQKFMRPLGQHSNCCELLTSTVHEKNGCSGMGPKVLVRYRCYCGNKAGLRQVGTAKAAAAPRRLQEPVVRKGEKKGNICIPTASHK